MLVRFVDVGAQEVSTPAGGTSFVLLVNSARPIPLRTANSLASLRVREQYTLIEQPGARSNERWRLIGTGYDYSLRSPVSAGNLFGDPELLAFHWHPRVQERGISMAALPHVHLKGQILGGSGAVLTNAHVPGGFVSLPDIIAFLVEEAGIRSTRRDWRRILADYQRALHETPAWPYSVSPANQQPV